MLADLDSSPPRSFLHDLKSWLTPTKSQEEIKDKVAQLHREAAARSYLLKEAEKAKAKQERTVAVAEWAEVLKSMSKKQSKASELAPNRTQWLKWEEFISMKAGARMGAILGFTGRFCL